MSNPDRQRVAIHELELMQEQREILRRIHEDPRSVASELVQARQSCRDAAAAAENLETMLRELVEQNATLLHLESYHRTDAGKLLAICRQNSQVQELGVYEEQVTEEMLELLQPWEYVRVHDGVVVGTWQDDPELLGTQFGDVVTFDGWADRDSFRVRVTHPGHHESVVTLAPPLRIEQLRPGMKLILQRDDPRWAVAALPAEHGDSKFEVDLDDVTTRLEELAGLEELTEAFLRDILLRVVFAEVREEFDLAPLRGALLYSHQPGMGKTAWCEGLAVWLRDFGREHGFDVVLYHVKPNQLKSMWWGEDSRIVREDLFGSIRARQRVPRERSLIQLVVFDEIDSLQKRSGGDRTVSSSSHSDALESLLVEMQGLGATSTQAAGPAVHLLCLGLTNRPDRLDDALKRPGRFGDLVRAMPAITQESAADIMTIYARKGTLPWSVNGAVQYLTREQVREQFLCPAVARVFPLVVARYSTDTQRTVDVTAGQMLAGVHYQQAMNSAKRRAAMRQMLRLGSPAICPEDIVDSLLEVATDMAQHVEADPGMLVHQLQIKVPVARVTAVPMEELEQHRFLKLHSA